MSTCFLILETQLHKKYTESGHNISKELCLSTHTFYKFDISTKTGFLI